MPNYCNNGLEIIINHENPELHKVVHSEVVKLIDGSLENRFKTIQVKLQKIALAGAAGLLKPHSSINVDEFNYLNAKTHNMFDTSERRNTGSSIAYTEFLLAIAKLSVNSSNFDYFDELYERVGIHNVFWGDIPQGIRTKMKSLIRGCGFDFGIGFRSNPEVYWSHNAFEKINESQHGELDFKMLTSIPVDSMINGFNGQFFSKKGITTIQSGYNFNCSHFGVKWENVWVDNTNELIEGEEHLVLKFATAWNQPNGLPELIKNYLVEKLNKKMNTEFDESIVDINLYFAEPGCAFQGINDDIWDYTINWTDEDEDEDDNLDERISNMIW
ncbi:DUF1281 domain-containing protein [Vibrio splendidus]|uniref:DUF1281 domain-containing protein n=1 Tax=Vibrio splendidus TaxID=29497 RepID=UPI00352C01A4